MIMDYCWKNNVLRGLLSPNPSIYAESSDGIFLHDDVHRRMENFSSIQRPRQRTPPISPTLGVAACVC